MCIAKDKITKAEGKMCKRIAYLCCIAVAVLGVNTSALAATIQYIGSGTKEAPVEISFSRNNGSTWQNAKVVPGQTFSVPTDATHLNILNTPRDPRKNYKIREGNIY